MNYNTEHQNFIILSKLSLVDYLAIENLWTELTNYLTPIIRPIKGIHNITAGQYIKDNGLLKHGRLTWKTESLQKLVDNYNNCEQKEKFTFSYLSSYFPNLTSCAKANVTPQVTLTLNDNSADRKFYGSGFFISFRNDYFNEVGEQKILNIIEAVSKLLKSVLRLRLKRAYAKPFLTGSWTDSLQDLFPTTAGSIKNDTLVVSKNFEDWQQF